jgi:hypothetical protein
MRAVTEIVVRYKVAEMSGGESERPLLNSETFGAPPPFRYDASLNTHCSALMPRVTVGTCRHSFEVYSELNYAVV